MPFVVIMLSVPSEIHGSCSRGLKTDAITPRAVCLMTTGLAKYSHV